MTSAVQLRRAVAADATAVTTVVHSAFEVYVERIGRPPFPMQVDYAAAIAEHEVWVTVEGETTTGCLVLHLETDHLLIDVLAVPPTSQGKGIGTRLLSVADDRARELGLSEVRLYTNEQMTENLDYYPARGYAETGREQVGPFRRVLFSKTVR